MALNSNMKKTGKIKSTAFIMAVVLISSIMLSVIANAGNLIFNSNHIRSIYTKRDYEIPQNAAGKGSVLSGIDVSSHNGQIDFSKTKRAGTEFVFIRVGYRGYAKEGNVREDCFFRENIKNAKKAGLKVGVYFFSQALTPEEAEYEAEYILDRIRPYRNMIDLPVVMDYEFAGDQKDKGRLCKANLSKQMMTENALAFINRVKKAGYTPCLYASVSFLQNNLYYERIEPVAKIWIAHYLGMDQKSTYYKGRVDYWQYSSFGYVDGVNGRVDANFGFIDENKNNGKNNNSDFNIDDTIFNPTIKNKKSIVLYRLYHPVTKEHFYTSGEYERDYLKRIGWICEGIAWKSPVKSNTPVYRLFNPNLKDHHYTIDAYEKRCLVNLGWVYEGIGWYSDDEKSAPIYRQFNPTLTTGSHNFTKSIYENDVLTTQRGWIAEGIAWYAL